MSKDDVRQICQRLRDDQYSRETEVYLPLAKIDDMDALVDWVIAETLGPVCST